MKKRDEKAHVAERVKKQFYDYLLTDEFGNFIMEKRGIYLSLQNKPELLSFLNICRAQLHSGRVAELGL